MNDVMMRCEVCGAPTHVRHFVPPQNPVRRILNPLVRNLREGKWVCKRCLDEQNKGK